MFYTQLEAAQKGFVTDAMKIVAEKEHMDEEELRALVALGQVVIPCNKNHTCIDPEGIGKALRTKINVNLGTSRDVTDYDSEIEKVNWAIQLGAESIMDLSTHGDTRIFRRKLTSECKAMIGTVPVYDSLIFAWMSMTGKENPFYEHFDDILDICREYDVTISLGDACRPGCLADATDVCQIEELVRLGELTKRARAKGVQVIIEGPGHVPLNQIQANMEIEETLCGGAPFYVLGPLVTDIAPGYDHITAAIGGAVAGMYGASFLCYVTPAEHLALPNADDVKEGIMAFKIAAHAADIARGIPGARDKDDAMADARRILDWEAQYACALDPEKARNIRESRAPEEGHSETCSMCGKFCAVRSMNKALNSEYIDIL